MMVVEGRMLIKGVHTEKYDTYINTFKALCHSGTSIWGLAKNGHTPSDPSCLAGQTQQPAASCLFGLTPW